MAGICCTPLLLFAEHPEGYGLVALGAKLDGGRMAAPEDRSVIVAHFAAKEKRDEDLLRDQLCEDVKWWTPQSTEKRGLHRPLVGRDNVLALLMSTDFYRTDGRSWVIHHLVAENGVVAAHATLTTETMSGHPYKNHYVFIFEMSDGRIAQVWEHLDTAYTYELLDN
jgi:ketosteroid isomerase-like protein